MTARLYVSIMCLVLLAACMTTERQLPRGKYHSKDEPGVIVFRGDGVFGYKFAAKFDLFDEANLPPTRGRISRDAKGHLDVRDIDTREPRFRIEWRPDEDSFDIVRIEPNGTLPARARYEKKG